MKESVAWVFGGQGCEEPGMGCHLPDALLLPLLEQASEVIGRDAGRILSRGGPGWGRTEIVQPLLVAVGLATAAALPGTPQALLGHSLGEFTAWAAAGGCTPLQAVVLAGQRGQLMAAVDGGMVVADQAPPGLALAVVNPGERVYAGGLEAVRRAVGVGARRVPVSGPWHSAALEPAAAAFRTALIALPSRPVPTWVGSSGLPATEALVVGLHTPFRWDHLLERMACNHVVICGPGKPLRRHLSLALPQVRVWRTDTASSLARTTTFLEQLHAA